jgi:hypothetical protein
MFFAVLVSSLALAIGIAIFDLVTRELQLSSTSAQSEFAIYAADTGVECVLYWDFKYQGTKSIFPTSTADTAAQNATDAYCNGEDIIAGRQVAVTANSGMVTTTISLAPLPYYVIVNVEKTENADGKTQTYVFSHGYNTASINSPTAVERELEVRY